MSNKVEVLKDDIKQVLTVAGVQFSYELLAEMVKDTAPQMWLRFERKNDVMEISWMKLEPLTPPGAIPS